MYICPVNKAIKYYQEKDIERIFVSGMQLSMS